MVEDVVGVTVVLGMDAKEGSSPSLTNSLAGQIGLLRSMLMAQVHVLEKNATLDPENPYLNVLIGKRTLFVEVC